MRYKFAKFELFRIHAVILPTMPFSNPSNGSTASISPTTGNNVVFLPSIIDTVACVGEDLLIENVKGSMCMVEDEKQLQKLNTSLAHLF